MWLKIFLRYFNGKAPSSSDCMDEEYKGKWDQNQSRVTYTAIWDEKTRVQRVGVQKCLAISTVLETAEVGNIPGLSGMADYSCSCPSFSQASAVPAMIKGHFTTQLLAQRPGPSRNPWDHRADLRRGGEMHQHSVLFAISLTMFGAR